MFKTHAAHQISRAYLQSSDIAIKPEALGFYATAKFLFCTLKMKELIFYIHNPKQPILNSANATPTPYVRSSAILLLVIVRKHVLAL
jgi:hypothetical protein